MSEQRKNLINDLVNDLEAVKPVNVIKSAIVWLVAAFAFAIVVTSIVDPFRESSLEQLTESVQFLIESVVGVFTIIVLIYTAFDMAIPSAKSRAKQLLLPLACLFIWVGFYIVGLEHPALAPSMEGKRAICWLETIIYAIPLMCVALYWCKKQYPVNAVKTGMMVGFASGAIPALLMQFACMYVPEHILSHHILPGLTIGLLGSVCGLYYLKK